MRSVLVVAVLAVAALVAGSCSSSGSDGGAAITVNGVSLSNAAFKARLDAIAGSPGYLATLTDEKGFPLTPQGPDEGSYSHDFIAQALSQQAQFAIAAKEVEKRGLTVTDEDRAAASDTLVKALSTSTDTQDDGSGQKALDDLGSFKPELVEGVASLFAVKRDITAKDSTDEALRKVFDESPESYDNQACTSALLVQIERPQSTDDSGVTPPSTAESDALARGKITALADRLQGGADIATLAPESDDAVVDAPDGDLGCRPLGTWKDLPELEQAIATQPVGTIGAVIKTDFGYWIVQVRARGALTFDQAKKQILESVANQAEDDYNAWYEDAFSSVDLAVDRRWAVWDRASGKFVAADGEPDSAPADTTPSSESTDSTPTTS